MSISMNNHETRIKALENKGSGSWTKGSNSNGYWFKESGSGMIIQLMDYDMPGDEGTRNRSFPIPFTTYYSIGGGFYYGGDQVGEVWKVDLNTFGTRTNWVGSRGYTGKISAVAIGY